MLFNTFCIVAGTENCTAGCKWCVASMTPAQGIKKGKAPTINKTRFDTACLMARMSNLDTARITGKGEPTIYPAQITEIMELLASQKPNFPFVEMQTHGAHLTDEKMIPNETLALWAKLGLTHVCISIVSYDPERNGAHYFSRNRRYRNYYDMEALIAKLHSHGINVRLTCIMQQGDIDCADELQKLMKWAKEVRADQVTVLPVNKPNNNSRNPKIYDAAVKAMLTEAQLKEIRGFAESGQLLRTLPWGAGVYDVGGQNLCLNYCLTRNPEDDGSRQLILYPPGTIGYDWEFEGATLYRFHEGTE